MFAIVYRIKKNGNATWRMIDHMNATEWRPSMDSRRNRNKNLIELATRKKQQAQHKNYLLPFSYVFNLYFQLKKRGDDSGFVVCVQQVLLSKLKVTFVSQCIYCFVNVLPAVDVQFSVVFVNAIQICSCDTR